MKVEDSSLLRLLVYSRYVLLVRLSEVSRSIVCTTGEAMHVTQVRVVRNGSLGSTRPSSDMSLKLNGRRPRRLGRGCRQRHRSRTFRAVRCTRRTFQALRVVMRRRSVRGSTRLRATPFTARTECGEAVSAQCSAAGRPSLRRPPTRSRCGCARYRSKVHPPGSHDAISSHLAHAAINCDPDPRSCDDGNIF